MRTALLGLTVGVLGLGLTAPALAQDAEVVFWQSISESSDGAEFCAYLEAYPSGKFAPLAKLRAKKLGTTCGTAAAQPSAPAPEPKKVTEPAPAPKPAPKPATAPEPQFDVLQGRPLRTADIRKILNTAKDGVAIKWEGGYCTRLQGDGTGRSISEEGGPSIANDFFDSQGSIGVWGVKGGGSFGKFCYKFSTWSAWECRTLRMDGRIVSTYPPEGVGARDYTGVILSADEYKNCPEMSYENLVQASRGGASTSVPDVDPMDKIMFALKGANVRAEPSTNGAKLFVMAKGEQVQVTGKVTGQNWYQIKLGGSDKGYIFGTLLGDQRPGGQTFANASETQKAPKPADTQAAAEDDGWTTFELEMDMFPDSTWIGKAGDCSVTLTFEDWQSDPQYTWIKNCDGNVETETLVYGLSPGFPWLNLPTEAGLFDLCRLKGSDDGAVRLSGCKYAGEYRNVDRAPIIEVAVDKYKADAPKREAERKASEERNRQLEEQQARKDAELAKTAYGKRLNSLKDRQFGQAPIPSSGQGIVVCTKHRLSRDPHAGTFPEGHVLNFNASREAEMEAELKAFGIPEFTLGKAPWIDRDPYTLFDVFDGIIFYDRNIERRPHPAGEGTWVIGEMRNAQIENFVSEAGPEIRCEVMLARKTCADPKDKKGNFSMPCG